MPNWCYNTLDVDFDYELRQKILIEIYNLNIIKKMNTPNDIIKKIISYLPLKYEDTYIENFVEECQDEGIARDESDYDLSGNFSFESGWGPPNETLLEISTSFPLLKIINEYEETNDNFTGTITIQGGLILEQEEHDLDAMAWEQYGGEHCGKDMVDYIINENIKIYYTENDVSKSIDFKSLDEIRDFVKVYGDVESLFRDPLEDYLYDYANDNELTNCEDKIMNEFEKLVLKN